MTCGTRGFKPAPLLGAALLVFGSTASAFRPLWGQGVTTAAMSGVVAAKDGTPLADATIVAVHVPSGTQYRAVTRTGGAYNVPNMRVGGPYRVTATRIGYKSHAQEGVFLSLGQDLRVDFALEPQAIELEAVEAAGQRDPVLNPGRTGAATFIDPEKVALLPSVKRSTRDLIRVDPRNDGNYSFSGRNWLYNNISLDGSYFNNPFGLDDPAPGGQTNAEPVPYDAVAQVQGSVAPFDVRQAALTRANVNTVTKSGTNEVHGSAYTFGRNQDLPQHPCVLSFNSPGRGPDQTSLPFANAGYAINNHLHSFALELNSRSRGFANRFFASYNRFRDFREPFSKAFPTIEIGQNGVTYTTVGHEPFSIHNILDQDVWQFTNNFSLFQGKHVFTLGANFETFSFFNSFNIFRYGVFFLPPPDTIGGFGGST